MICKLSTEDLTISMEVPTSLFPYLGFSLTHFSPVFVSMGPLPILLLCHHNGSAAGLKHVIWCSGLPAALQLTQNLVSILNSNHNWLQKSHQMNSVQFYTATQSKMLTTLWLTLTMMLQLIKLNSTQLKCLLGHRGDFIPWATEEFDTDGGSVEFASTVKCNTSNLAKEMEED